MRVHWEDEWAQEIGHPKAYDYGLQREFWLYHFATDWCGDDGVVLSMGCDIRKFNYIGDTQTLTGEVAAKRIEDDGRTCVDIAVRFVNQRGEPTTTGHATIALPSRAQGPARFAQVPAELAERAKAIMARHHELTAK